MYGSLKSISETAEGYRSALANIDEINESRDRLLVNYNSISKAEVERLTKVLPSNVDTVRLALDLDNIAGRYGITIEDVAIDKVSSQNATQVVLPDHSLPYEKTPVSISFVSNYQNFKRFLQDLERSLRIMDVKEIHFLVTDAGLYEHNVLIDTYWVN